MLISVCMCTYKRAHLEDTLRSIETQVLAENIELEVVVVDNDEKLSGSSIVDKLRDSYSHKLIYKSEPKKNISAARNMCLSNASGEWVAFIDDDEVADQHWLMSLFDAATKYKAQAVFGRVISTYPANTPSWIIDGGFFDRKERKTGSEVSSGACNCTLVSREAMGSQLFDLEYGLSGGEDADFFHRIYKKGHKLVYCQEAIVSEEIEHNRLNIDFLIKRKVRIGSSFTKYRFEKEPKITKLIYFAKNLCLLLVECILTLLTLPFGKSNHYKWRLRSADRYGKLKFFFEKKLQELY